MTHPFSRWSDYRLLPWAIALVVIAVMYTLNFDQADYQKLPYYQSYFSRAEKIKGEIIPKSFWQRRQYIIIHTSTGHVWKLQKRYTKNPAQILEKSNKGQLLKGYYRWGSEVVRDPVRLELNGEVVYDRSDKIGYLIGIWLLALLTLGLALYPSLKKEKPARTARAPY